jgi:hypothetical protein
MLKAKHNLMIYSFFKGYTLWKIHRHFHKVRLLGEFKDKKMPVLLISNHISWWDGFWVMYLNLKKIHRKFYFMMLEEQLRKFWFFNYTGGFSIKKKTRNVLESLHYASQLLSERKNLILIFPQGKIQSMHKQEFVFEKGIEKILTGSHQKVHILFVANITDYFSNPKPILYMYFEEYESDLYDIHSLQLAYNNFYNRCLDNQLNLGIQ